MYNNFTEEARRILVSAKKEMKELKHPYVGSEHFLLAVLKDSGFTIPDDKESIAILVDKKAPKEKMAEALKKLSKLIKFEAIYYFQKPQNLTILLIENSFHFLRLQSNLVFRGALAF